MPPQKKSHILIAEDDFMVSEIIQKDLENLGYIVVGKAYDGLKAVEMTLSLRPDLVLMDIEMPDMNGLEATEQIYQTCPTPVVMLTAYDSPDLVEQAGKAGAGAYLVKMPSAREIDRAVIIAVSRFSDMMTMCQLNDELETRNKELQKALDEIKVLKGILPLCSFCKKIRNDKNEWEEVDVYIYKHSQADISHGVCPECIKKHYPDISMT